MLNRLTADSDSLRVTVFVFFTQNNLVSSVPYLDGRTNTSLNFAIRTTKLSTRRNDYSPSWRRICSSNHLQNNLYFRISLISVQNSIDWRTDPCGCKFFFRVWLCDCCCDCANFFVFRVPGSGELGELVREHSPLFLNIRFQVWEELFYDSETSCRCADDVHK